MGQADRGSILQAMYRRHYTPSVKDGGENAVHIFTKMASNKTGGNTMIQLEHLPVKRGGVPMRYARGHLPRTTATLTAMWTSLSKKPV